MNIMTIVFLMITELASIQNLKNNKQICLQMYKEIRPSFTFDSNTMKSILPISEKINFKDRMMIKEIITSRFLLECYSVALSYIPISVLENYYNKYVKKAGPVHSPIKFKDPYIKSIQEKLERFIFGSVVLMGVFFNKKFYSNNFSKKQLLQMEKIKLAVQNEMLKLSAIKYIPYCKE